MATSIGGAAAAGLESGFGMGLRMLDQQEGARARRRREELEAQELQERSADREAQRARLAAQDKRLAAQDARQVRQDERQGALDALKALDSEVTDLASEGGTLFQQYGGYDKVPQALRDDFTGRVRSTRERRAEARRRIYEPDVAEQKRDAAEKWSRIQAGQLSIEDLTDDDLYRTLTVMTRRDLSDFLAPADGGPSRIQQAGLDLQAGLETGNQDLTLKAANVLLAPELRTGVGAPGRDGSEIVGKEIVQLVPHPEDPTQIVPIVKVTVRREDGAVGSYVAPITENRSSDPGDNVKTISMQDAFDRVGQLTTLAEALNRPDMRKRIEAGGKGGGRASADEFLQAMSSLGVKPPTKQITRDKLDLGDRVIERELDASGKVVGQTEHRKGATPRAFAPGGGRRATGLAATLQTIDDQVDEGLLGPDEAEDLKRAAISKAARGAGGGGGLKQVPPAGQKAILENDTNVRRAERALEIITSSGGKNATGLKGYLPNQLLNRIDPAGVDARAAIADLGSLLIHDRSGAAVTAAEFPRLAPFIPTEKDDQATAEKKLRRFVEIYRDEARQLEGTYSEDNGFRPFKVGGRDGGASGELEPGADHPVQLSRDPKAADAAYARLPSGATFIDPNGNLRRKP